MDQPKPKPKPKSKFVYRLRQKIKKIDTEKEKYDKILEQIESILKQTNNTEFSDNESDGHSVDENDLIFVDIPKQSKIDEEQFESSLTIEWN